MGSLGLALPTGLQLLQGDCLEHLRSMADDSVDAVVTDLPYGTTACKWDAVIPINPLFEQLTRVCRKDGAIVTTSQQPFTSMLIGECPDLFAYNWIWDKGVSASFVQAKRMPMRVHEEILVFCPSGKTPRYFPQMTPKEKPLAVKECRAYKGDTPIPRNARPAKIYTESYPKTIQYFSSRTKEARGLHPTQKPVDLYRYLVRTYTQPGEVVLDCCMGSGTTGVAALLEGRAFIGIESQTSYLEIARRRIEAVSLDRQPSLLEAITA